MAGVSDKHLKKPCRKIKEGGVYMWDIGSLESCFPRE